jgi:uncharacterized protein YjbI with pentapeptide repeats
MIEIKNKKGVTIKVVDAKALINAYLSGANLSRAYLSGANLSGANLSGAILPVAPTVHHLTAKILETIPDGGLCMATWHTCETTHCLAGWAVHLAGDEGKALETKFHTNAAGALIFHASIGKVPNFFASDEDAVKWLEENK